MRIDELLVIRPDMIATQPDGIPRWLRDEPIDRATEFMRLRDEGYRLIGIDPADDDEEDEE